MSVITLPRPLAEDATTITLDRAAWNALVQHVEELADLAQGEAESRRRESMGEARYMRETFSAAEVDRALAGEATLSILRRRFGLSQRALAEKAGIGPSYLNDIEKGRKPGSALALRKLAGALGVSMETLMA